MWRDRKKGGSDMVKAVIFDIDVYKRQGETGAEIKVNLDAEYFKWKEDADGGKEEKKPERHSFFGKRLK